jgi:hypothetical protein
VGDAEFTVTFLQPDLRYHIRAASSAERDTWARAFADAIHPRHAFIAQFESHPARDLACPCRELVAELLVHPLYCRTSRSSVQRWEVMFRCRAPSQAHAQQWHVHGIDVGPKQRSTLLTRAALC